jgi:hypothetical protein
MSAFARLTTRPVICGVTLAVAAALVALGLSTRRERPRYDTEEQLSAALLGKTQHEVRRLLGEPDGVSAAPPDRPRESWRYDDAYRRPLFVDFDERGTVRRVQTFKPLGER